MIWLMISAVAVIVCSAAWLVKEGFRMLGQRTFPIALVTVYPLACLLWVLVTIGMLIEFAVRG